MLYQKSILVAIEDLKCHETGSPIASIKMHVQAAADSADDESSWNDILFLKSLKTLVDKGLVVKASGSNYKLTDEYLERRIEEMQAQALKMQSASSPPHFYPREEPPKEIPKKKTVHAKVKINEPKIITVVNPRGEGNAEQMDITLECEGDASLLDEDSNLSSCNKKHKSPKTKIIPRRLSLKKCTGK